MNVTCLVELLLYFTPYEVVNPLVVGLHCSLNLKGHEEPIMIVFIASAHRFYLLNVKRLLPDLICVGREHDKRVHFQILIVICIFALLGLS